jgi:hypothetical protein
MWEFDVRNNCDVALLVMLVFIRSGDMHPMMKKYKHIVLIKLVALYPMALRIFTPFLMSQIFFHVNIMIRMFNGRENSRTKERIGRKGDEEKLILQRNGHFQVIDMMDKCPRMTVQRT